MKKYLETAFLVMSLLKLLPELIQSFEVPGFGKEKKNLVMELIKGVFDFMKVKNVRWLDVMWEDIQGLVSDAIDVIVGFFNAVGVFRKRGNQTQQDGAGEPGI